MAGPEKKLDAARPTHGEVVGRARKLAPFLRQRTVTKPTRARRGNEDKVTNYPGRKT
jgi:hypothetical protein